MAAKITGFKKVQQNLRREILQIKGRSMAGLIEAAILVRRDMEVTPPLIPVSKLKKSKRRRGGGNLRASWFTSPHQTPQGPSLVCGFNANYAVFVHEMVDKSGKKIDWSRPNSGPKFFEKALNRNHKEILEVIRNNARIR